MAKKNEQLNLLQDVGATKEEAEMVITHPETLNQDFIRLSADTAYIAAQALSAGVQVLSRKAARDRAYAAASYKIREDAHYQGRKLTEAGVEAAILTSEEYGTAEASYLEAEAAKAKWQALLEGLRAKRDALVGLGATQRAELAAEPYLRKLREEE